jgi:hypothetical protein
MIFNDDGAEIDGATNMEVYGDWIKFIDGEGAAVKITPSVVAQLMEFAIANESAFDEGPWG